MILPQTFFDFLPWLWPGLVVWLALWWRWLTKTTRLQKGLFSASIVICIAMWRFGPIHPAVAIVRFSKLGEHVTKTRGRLLFPMRYTFQDGKKTGWLWSLPEDAKPYGTVVLNDSPAALHIEYVQYESSPLLGFSGPPPTPVPPMGIATWPTAIDETGPDETPPETIGSQFGLGVRSWLTWDDASDE